MIQYGKFSHALWVVVVLVVIKLGVRKLYKQFSVFEMLRVKYTIELIYQGLGYR